MNVNGHELMNPNKLSKIESELYPTENPFQSLEQNKDFDINGDDPKMQTLRNFNSPSEAKSIPRND